MKSKIVSLSKNKDFKNLLGGKKRSNKYFTLFFKKLNNKNSKNLNISFVTKKKLGNAVKRNKIKRRLKNMTNDAVKKIGAKIKEGKIDANDINKDVIEENLYTSHLPQPSADMILRTSGEKRMSGFLMWQSAYSELVFLDVFWPEFRKIDLMRAIRTFQKRKRRVGK